MKEQLFRILRKFISLHKIRINQKELRLQLFSHPSYPSLHALTGVLSHFNINNLAVRLPIEKNTLQHLPKYYIAQIERAKGVELVLVKKQADNYKITGLSNKEETLRADQFLNIWKGVVLAIE